MSETENTTPSGLNRRQILKGAAWSVPVLAAAVATPLASASTTPDWNATVSGNCDGNYDLSLLESIIAGIPLIGDLALDLAQAALEGLELYPNATRNFTVTATTGDVPAGTTYRLTAPPSLISLSALQGVLDVSLLGVAEVNPGTGIYDITLSQPLAQGTSFTVNLYDAVANIGAASSVTLTQLLPDANTLDNSGTVDTILGTAVNLSDLDVPLLSGSLAIQVCGQR